MIGIVYRNDTKEVLSIIPDVVSHTETDITGKEASVKGIDLSQASFCIVAQTELKEGDTLRDFVDTRKQLPPALTDEIAALKKQNANFALIFAKHNMK